jgi:outer membrane protein OmpA-like peptidoglycan-associated protein
MREPMALRLLPLATVVWWLGTTPGLAAETSQTAAQWPAPDKVERGGPEADVVVQLGDIDNLGFGWPAGFDPFSGRSTDPHPYPWAPAPTDAPGTDRILVVSGYTGKTPGGDGYTGSTARPANQPVPLPLAFDTAGLAITSAALQLFVDDFQAPTFGTRYRVRLDGRDAPDIAALINRIDQTGPIGKLITVQILPEHLPSLTDGRLEISVDDASSDVGDGFAFDFVRLLINPKAWRHSGTVRGIAQVAGTGRPLPGVLVSVGNVRQVTTGPDGRFELREVPAGLVLATGSHPRYVADTESVDLVAGDAAEVTLELEPDRESSTTLARELQASGRVDLYGIYFDTDRAVLKPESEATLVQVLGVLTGNPSLRLVVAGHTDAEGTEAHNQDLSLRRAQAVVTWLTGKGVSAARLEPAGLGELEPVADNRTPEGRALNRRVEIRQR